MSVLQAPALRLAAISTLIMSLLAPGGAFAQRENNNTIAAVAPMSSPPVIPFKSTGSGTLNALDQSGKQVGKCPLKHTDVRASISGYVSRVTVKQVFDNPFKHRIEAVYTFPLSDSAAVDEMVMKIGNRTIKGTIKKREEAQQIYQAARNAGQVASLLDQERTNIFTQQVANIDPGQQIEVTLQYVELLPYDGGKYTFAFPTVVGPRFIPGSPTGTQGTGRIPDTDAVPDASRITPQITPEGTRTGHDISISVNLESAVPMGAVESKLHDVNVKRIDDKHASISLRSKSAIPNKDFVLSWQVAADNLRSGHLTHKSGESGFFTLMMMPPNRVTTANVAPKEMIFLIDCSGSQSGKPLEKAKETMKYILGHMNPQDTFQIISFSDHLRIFGEKPLSVSPDMRKKAAGFIDSLQANGGTWMAPAVEKACSLPADGNRLRIVTFMTDGYVGNDFQVLGMIRKLRGTSRWFSFGTGNSVNRMLIEGIAKEGGGEADYVLLNTSGAEVGKKFYDRISSPVLTDVKVDWGGLPVKEVFPNAVSDVWAQRPLYFTGRYIKEGKGTVTISGFAGGKPYSEKIEVTLPATNSANASLGSIWARAKVDRLMSEDYFGAQAGTPNKELKDEIVRTALEHHIMTQYTSFVAVDSEVKKGEPAQTVAVPVEMPQGVEYKSIRPSGGAAGSASHAMMNHHRRFPLKDEAGGKGRFAFAPAASPAPRPAPRTQFYKAPAQAIAADEERGLMLREADPAHGGLVSPPALSLPASARLVEKQLAQKRDEPKNKQPSKLDAVLQAIVQSPAAALPKWLSVKNGKLQIIIWLNDISEGTIKKLQALGFEIEHRANGDKQVIGRIAIEKLKEVASLSEVRLVEPPRMK